MDVNEAEAPADAAVHAEGGYPQHNSHVRPAHIDQRRVIRPRRGRGRQGGVIIGNRHVRPVGRPHAGPLLAVPPRAGPRNTRP